MIPAELSSALTADQRERFDRDGYLLLDSTGWTLSVVDAAIADLDGLYAGEGRSEGGVTFYERRIQDAWRISPNVLALALSPEILALLRSIYEREPLPFQTLNFRVGSEQAVHSDTLHFNSDPPGFMCGVWVALEDIDMDNGPLVYFPGSHKFPEVTMQDVGVNPTFDDYPHYERYIAELIEREGLEPAYGTMRKGQALIWSANLLHGGLPQRDPARTRHSLVTHFFFEGCRYYTPMMSGGGHVEWRDPDWITTDAAAGNDELPYSPQRIREAIDRAVPGGSFVLVVTKGDEQLLQLGDRRAAHFPTEEPWNHPADSDEAIAALDAASSAGADHLVIPSVSMWWLEHYLGFAEHLERHARPVHRDEDCIVYAL